MGRSVTRRADHPGRRRTPTLSNPPEKLNDARRGWHQRHHGYRPLHRPCSCPARGHRLRHQDGLRRPLHRRPAYRRRRLPAHQHRPPAARRLPLPPRR